MIPDLVTRALAPIKRRVLNMLARAVVQRVRDEPGGLQVFQLGILKGEVRDGVERFGEFGLHSKPPEGADAVAGFLGGNRDHGVVLGVEHRPSLPQGVAEGDVVLYNAAGTKVTLRGPDVIVEPAGGLEVLSGAEVEGDLTVGGAAEVGGEATVTGNVVSMGNVTAAGIVTGAQVTDTLGTSLALIKAVFNTHTHPMLGGPPNTQI